MSLFARKQHRSTEILAIGVFLFAFLYGFGAHAQTTAGGDTLGGLERTIQEIEIQIVVLQVRLTEARDALRREKEEPSALIWQPAAQEINAPIFTRTLSIGSRGEDVRELQKFLSQFPDLYPEKLQTGFYGSLTAAAVRKFQERHNIEAVGNIGPKTLTKINDLLTSGSGKSDVVPPGLTMVPGIQKKLATTSEIQLPIATTTTPFAPSTTTTSATTTIVEVTTTVAPVNGTSSGTSQTTITVSTPSTTTTATISSSITTASNTTSTPPPLQNTVPITITSPNGGETWDMYFSNQGINYLLKGVSRVGFKILKGSQVVYSNSAPITTNSTTLSLPPSVEREPSSGDRVASPYYNAIGFGSDYKIRVFNWDSPEVYDDSDNYFTIPKPDITPPVVSSVLASSITANSAVITWTTDEPALGYVNYGSVADWAITPYDNSWAAYVTPHSYTLSNLKSGTLYTFRVYNFDAKGNSAVLSTGYPPEHTFTTAANTCSNLTFTLSNNKTTFAIGDVIYVSYTCPSVITVHSEIVKPDGTAVNIGSHNASSGIDGFDTRSSLPGNYSARVCYGTYMPSASVRCQSIAATLPFTLTGVNSAPSTNTSTTTSLQRRKENLAAISQVVGSLNAALDALIQLLKR
ncbi:MAG: mucin-2-like [Parcubacteria group bacterium Gr01-1014_17]|nr:MAG: mucin-2-like [Parcubacteria group bacterium Gr01-1014_17]